MDLDQQLEAVKAKIEEYTPLTESFVDPDISENSAFLKMVTVNAYNWTAPHMTKMSSLRYVVKVPPMNVLNLIIYPDRKYDAPIFLSHIVIAAGKVIYHLNLIRMFKDDPAYDAKWIDPLKPILAQYDEFKPIKKYPDWMDVSRHHSTIMGIEKKDRLDDLYDCTQKYLDFYLQQLVNCEEVTDPDRLAAIDAMHEQFRDDVRTKDKAQKMTSGMIGKEKSKRIFYEVAT